MSNGNSYINTPYTSSLSVLWYNTFNKSASTQEIEWYKKYLNLDDKIAELMCGSGRILLPLAAQGYDIQGIDYSKPMLDSLELSKTQLGLKKPIVTYHQSIENLDLPNTFNTIIIAYGSFQLLDRSIAQKTLEKITLHLKPNGRLLIDLFVPTQALEQEKYTYNTHINLNFYTKLYLEQKHSVDIENKLITSLHTYTKTTYGFMAQKEHETIKTTWYTDEEITNLCQNAGLVIQKRLSVPFEIDPPGFLFVTSKV